MKIKTQLLFTQLPNLLIIGLIAWSFIAFINSIKEQADLILVKNYKSISHMINLNKHLEDLNDLYIKNPTIMSERPSEINPLKIQVDQQLLLQKEDLKSSREKELTETLHQSWQKYLKTISLPFPSPIFQGEKVYKELKSNTNAIIQLNLDRVIATKEKLSKFITQVIIFILVSSGTAIIFSLFLFWFFSGLFLDPLNTLAEMIRKIGEEEKTILINLKGSEEIEKLCNEFNLMAIRLQGYQRDSLQKALESFQLMKDALDAWPEAILIVDKISNFIYVNKAARHILNLSHDFKKVPSLFHVNKEWKDLLLEICNNVLATGLTYQPNKEKDVLSFFIDKKKAFFLPWAYPIKRESSKNLEFEGILIILQDLLHKPFSEERKADAYERLTHDFRPPLNEVRMAIHLLCVEGAAGPLTEKQKEILMATREKCDYMENISQSLLSLSRGQFKKQGLPLQEMDLSIIVTNLINGVKLEANQKKIIFNFESPPYLTLIKANSDEVQTIVGNLLRNAVHYAKQKSTINVELQESHKFIEFKVSNQGPSIPLKYRQNIFKKNFKVPGQEDTRAGLGLYIVKKIVTSMKGRIGFKSSAKKGTIFWVKFPLESNKEKLKIS
ncbi:MAG TPA: hypothetical protein DEP85_06665 [Holosporales bacterium]|nr:hypothetical protein [Holosporales bacterium]